MTKPKGEGKKGQSCGWRASLFWCVAGAILETASSPPMEGAKTWATEFLFHGKQYYEEGRKLRREAIKEGSIAKHQAANRAFQRSINAPGGPPEAYGQLAIAYGIGLGLDADFRRCRALVIEAVRRDGSLGSIYLLDKDVCQISSQEKK